jgi:hypothetical protein
MDKELRELLSQIETIKAEARQLLSEDKVADAEAKAKEARDLQKKADLMKELANEQSQERGKKISGQETPDTEGEYRNVFMKAASIQQELGLRSQRPPRLRTS